MQNIVQQDETLFKNHPVNNEIKTIPGKYS